ncbi:abhydrolase domain-containing protein 3 [Thecamonas trahens ATCC 50062]|uniref:Abhydrolase domain-containing protein 3 n=1 Tax=Thecamonas trahens ATCC 50062 TaxID=461836 RepID=A0A0L0DL66_THETB|nr:abhydrolase domain-containing protein 3 [Thecamonas trahens ATCC 50062]KNC53057.1 abhydrolase domain-containing protein 3 [Thecamonas trahens ATCC 50062]|eukprot:XP_013754733.1 abhydrolase domain-containing protein 3 [Thecamonas trahens ATCC 50062]
MDMTCSRHEPLQTLQSTLLLGVSPTSPTLSTILTLTTSATALYGIHYFAAAAKPPTLVVPSSPSSPHSVLLAADALPTLREPYYPPFLLDGGHTQTVLAARLRPVPRVDYLRTSLFLADGGMVALDWATKPADITPHTPVMLVLHGLTGGSDEGYVRLAVRSALAMGWAPLVFNYRGAAGTDVLTPRGYSASATDDLDAVLAHVKAKAPHSPLFAVGFSLGANILSRHLCDAGSATPVDAAVALCCPFSMIRKPEHSLPWIYERIFTANLVRFAKRHPMLAHHPQVNPADLDTCRTVRDFDAAVTVPVFGHKDVDDYYRHATVAGRISGIKIPTLFLSAADDPIVPEPIIPTDDIAANPYTMAAITRRGGHCAWLEHAGVWGPAWSDHATIEFFSGLLDHNLLRRAPAS